MCITHVKSNVHIHTSIRYCMLTLCLKGNPIGNSIKLWRSSACVERFYCYYFIYETYILFMFISYIYGVFFKQLLV